MTLAGIKIGDIVRCDVRGDVFYGLVDDKIKKPNGLMVRPIGARSNFPRHVTSHQVRARYKRMNGS